MPEIIVLDTHIWFWFVNGDFDLFPSYFRERIEQADMVGISPVSCFEIALARQKGRISLPCETRLWLKEALVLPVLTFSRSHRILPLVQWIWPKSIKIPLTG